MTHLRQRLLPTLGALCTLAWPGLEALAYDRPAFLPHHATDDPFILPEPGTNWAATNWQVKANLQSNRTARRPGVKSFQDTYGELTVEQSTALPFGFGFNATYKLKAAARDPTGRNRWFANQTAYVDQAFLTWQYQALTLFAGKIHPRFGFGWDIAPGLYGTDFAEEYELTEKLGMGAEIHLPLPKSFGNQSVQAEFFQADRSLLSGGLGTRRHSFLQTLAGGTTTAFRVRNSEITGGADNTKGIGNYVLSYQGTEVVVPGGELNYTLGYSSRRAGQDQTAVGTGATETGLVAGVAYQIWLPELFKLTPFAEWVRLDNVNGAAAQRSTYATLGFDLERKPFTFSYAYLTNLQEDRAAGTHATRVQNAASITTDLTSNLPQGVPGFLNLVVGWRNLRELGASGNDFGVSLVWKNRI